MALENQLRAMLARIVELEARVAILEKQKQRLKKPEKRYVQG